MLSLTTYVLLSLSERKTKIDIVVYAFLRVANYYKNEKYDRSGSYFNQQHSWPEKLLFAYQPGFQYRKTNDVPIVPFSETL